MLITFKLYSALQATMILINHHRKQNWHQELQNPIENQQKLKIMHKKLHTIIKLPKKILKLMNVQEWIVLEVIKRKIKKQRKI